jgi:hypothetical protein
MSFCRASRNAKRNRHDQNGLCSLASCCFWPFGSAKTSPVLTRIFNPQENQLQMQLFNIMQNEDEQRRMVRSAAA